MASTISTPRPPRTRLPAPMTPRDQISIWSILKNCIGKELSKITMPVVFNEPLTMLQRSCESVQYSHFLKKANSSDDPVERIELVCAFIIASLSANCHRIIKPFNPMLYETYELEHRLQDNTLVRALAQQVSHHPPITAACCESDDFAYHGVINPKIKFWGRSVEITHDGSCRVHLKQRNETYEFNAVACSVHNIIVGKLRFEHHGPLNVKCAETNLQANLIFKQAGWFSNDSHRFEGFIVSGSKDSERKLKFVYGKWSDYIKSVDYSEYDNHMRENQQKSFRIPDNPDLQKNGTGDKKIESTKDDSTQLFDIPNSRTLWKLDSQYLSEFYNFTSFTMRLNELTQELERTLPRTDSRFRLDVRKLEEGDLDAAASEKNRLEEKQRAARARDKRFKDPSPDFLWFEPQVSSLTKEKLWIYKGGYWQNKCNTERFPDLF